MFRIIKYGNTSEEESDRIWTNRTRRGRSEAELMAKSCDGADVLALELTRYTAFNNALSLLLGIAVIGGAILFKTRREAIAACADRIRGRLGGWE
jgi:hypothetical protein